MKTLPIGIENFKELIDEDYYYVDKTKLILNTYNEKLVLFTRPRRFGKTLNMSMLYYFYSNKEIDNAYLFHNLEVSQDQEVMKHQNQYPTIFITLKDMKNDNLDSQLYMFKTIIARILDQFEDILDSDVFNVREKELLNKYHTLQSSTDELKNALLDISLCLFKYYHQKVIILIDEYDVPLQSAYTNNYYDEMVNFLRSVFSTALKTNDALEKGVMTGCLRIAKESIFTGLNNFNVYSIMNEYMSDTFGFVSQEVKQILNDYQLIEYYDDVKEWYDGYLFGNTEIYNPWSVLKYVQKAVTEKPVPESFWANTSGNDLVYNYIQRSDKSLYDEFEILLQGESIIKRIKPELTYRDMDKLSNIYSFLLFTGYLKIKENKGNYKYELVIPNKEVYEIYQQSFIDYFTDFTNERKGTLYQYLVEKNVYQANTLLNEILMKSISYYDNQENFYHGFLVGMFSDKDVESNKESGDGRFDLCILPDTILGTVIVVECKHSMSDDDLIEDATLGARQIIEKRYLEDKRMKKYSQVIGYGISFYKKQCYVVKAQN